MPDIIAATLKRIDDSYQVLLAINLGSSGAYEVDSKKIPLFRDRH